MTDAHLAGSRLDKLPVALKLSYAAGQMVDGVVTNTLNIFLLFYLTAVCGMPGALAGAALSAGLIVDALMDPLIGSASDAWRSRLGRRLPFMLVGAPAVSVAFVLIFWLPTGLSTTALFLWVALLSVLLRVSMSMFILPYQAVGAEITDDARERSGLVAWRWGLGIVGALIAAVLGFGVFFSGPKGLSQREAYLPFAASLLGLVAIGTLASTWAVAATRGRQHAPPASTVSALARLRTELGEVFRNRSFCVLFVGALLFFVALGLHGSLTLHANTFFWQLTPAQTKQVTLSTFAGLLVGAPLAGPLLARLEKRTVLIIGMVGLALSMGVPALLRLAGWFDLSGDRLALALSLTVFAGAVLMAAAAIAFGSMMADAADEHEDLFDARREGLYFAGWAFAGKAAGGGGTLIAGLVLQLIAFPTTLAQQGGAAAALSESTRTLLGIAYGPGAAVLVLAAVMVTLSYRLDSAAHAVIMSKLRSKRAVLDLAPEHVAPACALKA